MKLRWHGEARAEADAAAAFYNEKQPGLAQRFMTISKMLCIAYSVILKPTAFWRVTSANAEWRISPTE